MARHVAHRRAVFFWRWRALGLALAMAFLTVSPAGAAAPAVHPASQHSFPIRAIENVSYGDRREAASSSHTLDLFLPEEKKDFPVVVFVHGGSWMYGDKTFSGWSKHLGSFYARHGIGAVMPNYRLAPQARHPDQVKDVAKAFAWTARNIQRYGGAPDQLFLCGHSAGGHLVSLLATDETYLKAEGLEQSAIKGVISVSGVYQVFGVELRLGIAGKRIKLALEPIDASGEARRAEGAKKAVNEAGAAKQMSVRLDIFGMVFGTDARTRREASPLSHVKSGLPPFLIVNAGQDFPGLAAMAADFTTALKNAKCIVQVLTVQDRNHDSVMFEAGRSADPVARAIEGFVMAHIPTKTRSSSTKK
jgi:acetyl esterase/lipase